MLKQVPVDRLRVLLDNYRTASHRAHAARKKDDRIELDGRYHLDGVPPQAHDAHHDERHAAVMLAESLMRWVDDGARRTASHRAHDARKKDERIDLDGRYHLDGVPPPAHDAHHGERHAAVMVAESLMRWVDDGGR